MIFISNINATCALGFRYRARFLDDDEDLKNMESSYDQIEREEEFRYVSKYLKYFYINFIFFF